MGADAGASEAPYRLQEMLARLVPDAAVVRAVGADDEPSVLPFEPADISDPDRMRRFALGRTCARRALAELGSLDLVVGRGPQREPRWPEGFVGSITHSAGLSVAAVASASEVAGLGIDVEPNNPLPDGVEDLVVTDGVELPAGTGGRGLGIEWSTVLFSAKESIYKAWFARFGSWLDFHDVIVELSATSPTEGEYRVVPSRARPVSNAQAGFVSELRGRYEIDPALGLVAAATVAPSPSGRHQG